MPRGFAGQSKRPKLLIICLVAILLLICEQCIEYRSYAFAIVWHCTHGRYSEIGGHKVRIPILWWKANPYGYGESLVVRASHANMNLDPKIVVTSLPPGTTSGTDQETLKSIQALISVKNHQVVSGWSSSLLILDPKLFRLYCIRDVFAFRSVDRYSSVQCFAAGIPYSFTYQGSPRHEKEAESILSTLE